MGSWRFRDDDSKFILKERDREWGKREGQREAERLLQSVRLTCSRVYFELGLDGNFSTFRKSFNFGNRILEIRVPARACSE